VPKNYKLIKQFSSRKADNHQHQHQEKQRQRFLFKVNTPSAVAAFRHPEALIFCFISTLAIAIAVSVYYSICKANMRLSSGQTPYR